MEMNDELREALGQLARLLEDDILPKAEAHRDDLMLTIEDLEEDDAWEGTADQGRFDDALSYLDDAVGYLKDAARALIDASESA